MKVNFKCKKCGSNILEEVLGDVTKYSAISAIELLDNGYAAIEYGNSNDENGDFIVYQCASCGEEVDGCYNENNLFEYLKENNMLGEN